MNKEQGISYSDSFSKMEEMSMLNVSGESRLLVIVFYYVLGFAPILVFFMINRFMN
jgi:hypothetical protein